VYSNVTVSPQSANIDASNAETRLASIKMNGATDETRNLLSAIGTRVTRKSCALSPNCESLNRETCSDLDNTCGSCLLNFIGQLGPHNSPCIDPQELNSPSDLPCESDSSCGKLQSCNLDSRLCEISSKSCAKNCSQHGVCRFLSESHVEVSVCKLGDPFCEPVCVCSEGYGGTFCQYDSAQLSQQRDLMSVLVNSLSNLMSSDDTSEESVISWQSNLYSFTRDPSMLSDSAILSALNMSSSVLSSAATLSVSSSQMSGVVDSMDSILSFRPTSLDACQNSLDTLVSMTSGSSLVGQDNEEFVYSNFRYVSAVSSFSDSQDSKIELSSPQTNEDVFSGRAMNSVEIFSDPSKRRLAVDGEEESKLGVVLMQMKAALYSGSLDTNPLRLYLTGSGYGNFTFTFHNMANRTYGESETDPADRVVFNTTCEAGILKQEKFLCPSVPGEGDLSPRLLVEHNCSGLPEILSTPCLGRRKIPFCQVMDGSADCFVSNHSQSFTTCNCRISSQGKASRKLNSVVTMSIQVVSSVVYVSNGFGETLSSPLSIDSADDLSRILIVIFLYGILWVGGLSLLGICAFRRYKSQRDYTGAKTKQNQIPGVGSDMVIVQSRLLNYVDTIIPSVYNNRNWVSRMLEELSKHHRYLALFIVNDEFITESRRILTGIQLLTVQAMLMFFLAVACDIQFPMDDGTCAQHDTKDHCLAMKSRVDSSKTYCEWRENDFGGHCKYADPAFDINAVIIVSIVVAILTAPINFFVDFLFVDILSAQTEDDAKATAMANQTKISTHPTNSAANVIHRTSISGKGRPKRNTFVGHEIAKKIPGATSTAHVLALESTGAILSDAQRRLALMNDFREQNRSKILVDRQQKTLERKLTMVTTPSLQTKLGKNIDLNGDDSEQGTLKRFAAFAVDVSDQRKALKPTARDQFDSKWVSTSPCFELWREAMLGNGSLPLLVCCNCWSRSSSTKPLRLFCCTLLSQIWPVSRFRQPSSVFVLPSIKSAPNSLMRSS
jgi:hypothetical protein